jgi:hypothetical protein
MRKAIVAALAAALAGGAAVLYWVPPTADSYYPRCTFYTLTGLYCPGCGSTRCLHALLHGDVAQAAAYNLLVLCALPFLAAWGVRALWTTVKPATAPGWRAPPWLLLALVGVIVTYWIVRNLNVAPFDLLAPHELQGRGQ